MNEMVKDNDATGEEIKQNIDRIKSIKDVKVDDASGALSIESSNISRFDVKYYLIDAEILFSRTPFL
jgi:hypothetical protein